MFYPNAAIASSLKNYKKYLVFINIYNDGMVINSVIAIRMPAVLSLLQSTCK